MGRARRAHPGRAARGQPGRELEPGRRLEGHVGARRRGRATASRLAARRRRSPGRSRRCARPTPGPPPRAASQQAPTATAATAVRRAVTGAEPDRGVAVLDRPLQRAGRGHRAPPRRPLPPAARGPAVDEATRVPGAARRDGRARRRARRRARTRPRSRCSLAHDRDVRRARSRSSLDAAWENARGAREAISSEMWETLNTTHRAMSVRSTRDVGRARHEFFGWVRERAAMLAGLADSTMSRDDGWRFLLARPQPRAGRHDRRGCSRPATARAGGRRAGRPLCGAAPRTRRTCAPTGARSTRRRRSSSCSSTGSSRGRCSTRSRTAEQCLGELDPSSRPGGRRRQRADGRWARCRAELEFCSVDELSTTCPGQLAACRPSAPRRARAVADRYFRETAGDRVERMSWRSAGPAHDRLPVRQGVHTSYNEARISPPDTANQFALDTRVDVSPAAHPSSYRDYWGTIVHTFDLHLRTASSSSPGPRRSRRPAPHPDER